MPILTDFIEPRYHNISTAYYYPLVKLEVISLRGYVYSNNERLFSFCGKREVIISHDKKLRSGEFDKRSGIIGLIWNEHIENHYLKVTYKIKEKSKVNWRKEGF